MGAIDPLESHPSSGTRVLVLHDNALFAGPEIARGAFVGERVAAVQLHVRAQVGDLVGAVGAQGASEGLLLGVGEKVPLEVGQEVAGVLTLVALVGFRRSPVLFGSRGGKLTQVVQRA